MSDFVALLLTPVVHSNTAPAVARSLPVWFTGPCKPGGSPLQFFPPRCIQVLVQMPSATPVCPLRRPTSGRVTYSGMERRRASLCSYHSTRNLRRQLTPAYRPVNTQTTQMNTAIDAYRSTQLSRSPGKPMVLLNCTESLSY